MDENISELLTKVEDALFQGDQRVAGILLHKVLMQDFTNHPAWQLLHSLRGGEQPFPEFQQAFAQKYYPQMAHLLSAPPSAPELISPEPLAPALNTLLPACGAILSTTAKFCIYCGHTISAEPGLTAPSEPEPKSIPLAPTLPIPEPVPLAPEPVSPPPFFPAETPLPPVPSAFTPAPSPLSPDATVRLTRLKTFVGAAIKFNVLIDGIDKGTLTNGEEKTYSLPAGEHTVVVKLRKNSSLPVALRLNPAESIQLACQAPKYSLKAIGPDLQVIPSGASLPKARGVFAWLWPVGCILFLVFGCLGAIAGVVGANALMNQ